MKLKIISKIETSDHCGWCSGNECKYKVTNYNKIIDISEDELNEDLEEFLNRKTKKFSNDRLNKIDKNYWIKYIPEPNLNTSESYYCDVCDESVNAGLKRHEFRINIIKVIKIG